MARQGSRVATQKGPIWFETLLVVLGVLIILALWYGTYVLLLPYVNTLVFILLLPCEILVGLYLLRFAVYLFPVRFRAHARLLVRRATEAILQITTFGLYP